MIGDADALTCRSPNAGERRGDARPDMVIVHYTAMRDARAARDWLCNPEAQVSAHYLIAPDGTCWQMVDEAARAWHAGVGAWGDVDDINSRSIGIELSNTGSEPFAAPLMDRLERVLAGILERWAIPPDRVLGHSDIALGRKIDPGPRFDWRRLARQGLAVQPPPATPGQFDADARVAGYRWQPGQEPALLAAIRHRLRPWATSPMTDADRAAIAGLARHHPCRDTAP